MTPPDEIVCETVVAFHAKLRTHHGIALYGNPVNPGDSVTLGGITVVYRPPAQDRCPRCGSTDQDRYYADMSGFDGFTGPCFYDGDYHPWHAAERIAVRFAGHRAGKAPTSFSQRQLDMEWNAAIETAAAIEGACCNTNAKKILCLRRHSP